MGLGLIAGAMAGAGEAGVASGLEAQKQYGQQDLIRLHAEAEQALARTQATLARETHSVNTQTDIAAIPQRGEAETKVAVDRAKRVPQKLGRGESIAEGDKITVTAPTGESDSLKAYHEALANRLNADAEAIRNQEKYRGKAPQLPSVSKEANPDGTYYLIDKNSGAIGKIIPGSEAKAAVTHWFKADEPAKAAIPDVVQWTSSDGRVLKGGLGELYPAMHAPAGVSAPAASAPGATPASTGAPQAAIDYLQKNPDTAADFDAKYGAGAAAKLIKPAAAKPAAKPPAAAPAGMVNKQVSASASPAQGMDDFESRRASVLQRIEASKNDPQIKALEAQRATALRQGKTVEANNITAQIKKLTETASAK